MEEVWKPIKGLEGMYEASTLGNIRSVDRFVNHRYGKRKVLGKQLKPNTFGEYMMVNVAGKVTTVHELIAITFIDKPNPSFVVNHKDGIKFNNFASNLEWVSQSDNLIHSINIGTTPVGEQSTSSKLTAKDVIEIRKLHSDGYTKQQLANKFNVAKATIADIYKNRTWKQLK